MSFCACYFGFVRLFFANFSHASKGSPLQFFDIFQQSGLKKTQMAPSYIFRHYETVPNSHFSFFPNIIFCLQKEPFHFFLIFRIQLDFQKSQSPPFYNFRHCETFPISASNFSQVFLARYNRILFFLRPAFFSCDFFPIYFYRNPLSIFTRKETFCEHRGLLRVFGTMQLTGDFIEKIFSSIFSFLRGFVVSSWGESGFRVLCVSLEVYFRTVKLMNF